MNDNFSTRDFEQEITSLLVSSKPSEEYISRLSGQLKLKATQLEKQPVRPLLGRLVFISSLAVVTVLVASMIFYSPQAVYAAVCRLFGYMPGIGIVDESASVRILKQPVSVTREGVTITVNRAILDTEGTQIDYDISGIPAAAYADKEHASGCPIPEEYLILPDGTQLESYAPLPSDVDKALFSIPCIFNTLPDSVPTKWEIPLEFMLVSPQATVLPVVEQSTDIEAPTDLSSADLSAVGPYTLLVDQYIEADDSYILIGSFHTEMNKDGWMQITRDIQITDANQQTVPYSVPEDIRIEADPTRQSPWVIAFDPSGVAFPVSINIGGNVYAQIDSNPTASLDFDAGANPQFGQEWPMNLDLTLGKYHILLEKITASENGYTFVFKYQDDSAGSITMPRVQIEGFESIGGGGGGGPDGGETNLDFREIPTGKLHIIFSEIFNVTNDMTWEVQWQPDLDNPN